MEDTDSLRFALSVYDEFDVAGLQPHFPGYPVYWFLAKLLYLVTGSFAVAFSLIGGLATFAVATFVIGISRSGGLWAVEPLVLAALVFFNPLIWLMGNRYMPDVAGLALALATFYVLASGARGNVHASAGFALAGLLAGLRLSYVPFVLIPLGVAFFTGRGRLRKLGSLAAGVAVWLVPMILDTGWRRLVEAATAQTEGHFTEFGGTIETNPDLFSRVVRSFEAVWADGLGGFWWDRHWLTIIVGVGLLLVLFPGIQRAVDRMRSDRTLQLLVASTFLYGVWMLFFQNVVYKSRHVLPLLPLVLLVAGWGAAELLGSKGRALRVLTGAFLIAYAAVATILAVQHRSPTAIAQAKTFIDANASETDVVVSIPLVNFYLSAQGVEARYVSIDDTSAVNALPDTSAVFVVGHFPDLLLANPARSDTFYHNPYVNRMWPEVQVHVY